LLARVQVRRGHQDSSRLLAEAWELAVSLDEIQRIGPAAAACAKVRGSAATTPPSWP